MTVKYPQITIKEFGKDGNAFALIGQVTSAMRAKLTAEQIDEFRTEATEGDYNHLLQVIMSYVNVDMEDDDEDEDFEDDDEDEDFEDDDEDEDFEDDDEGNDELI